MRICLATTVPPDQATFEAVSNSAAFFDVDAAGTANGNDITKENALRIDSQPNGLKSLVQSPCLMFTLGARPFLSEEITISDIVPAHSPPLSYPEDKMLRSKRTTTC